MRFLRATRQVVVKIAGAKHWLWRAVDQDGTVLDILMQSRRDKRAAKRLLRKLLKRQCRPPRVMITDKLASYGAAKKEIMPGVVLAAARIRVNTATDPLLLPIVCQLALVGRKDSSQPPTSTAECGWVADPNQRWPSAPAFGG